MTSNNYDGTGPPPAYGGPNPSQYNQPPSNNQPPSYNQGTGAPPPASGYNAPPQANYNAPHNPPNYSAPPNNYAAPPNNYAAPPNNYAAPPNNYAAPPNNYAAPPNNYAAPPNNYNAPPANNYAAPPPGGPSYAQPPTGGPGPHSSINTYSTNNNVGNQVQRRNFTFGLCDCFGNFKYCFYVMCCNSCAIADLRAAFDGSGTTWWVTVGLMFFSFILMYIPGIQWLGYLGYTILSCYFLTQIANNLRSKLNMANGDGCMDCCISWFCASCRTCQLGRELELTNIDEIRELVLNVQQASPCGQACMNSQILV